MHFVNWFEIPVYDIRRAAAFYGAIYGFQMETSQNGEYAMALFPAGAGIGGALVAGPGCTPSDVGVLVYLNAGTDFDTMLARVEISGGRVVMPRTFISEQSGSFAVFIDSEGNRLALHEAPVPAPAPVFVNDETAAPAQLESVPATTAGTTSVSRSESQRVKKRSANKRR